MTSIQVNGVRVTGTGKADAFLTFSNGLNVVTGASDTGKSYVVELIDFLTGASRPINDISEAAGYTTAHLDLSLSDDARYRLSRALKGGNFALEKWNTEGGLDQGDPPVLAAKHAAKSTNNVSAFLLTPCNLWGKRLLKNQDGQTSALSFRDLAHLVIVKEEDIYKTTSPILSENQPENPRRKSVFRLLLTGVDDSEIVQEKRKADLKVKQEAEKDILTTLIADAETELAAIAPEPDQLSDQIARLDDTLGSLSQTITVHRDEIRGEQVRRKQSWDNIQDANNRLIVVTQLIDRFQLLRTHYKTDLNRLSAIIELQDTFTRYPEQQCPLCGSSPTAPETVTALNLDELQVGCAREIEKINLFLTDLDTTTNGLIKEEQALTKSIAQLRDQYDASSERLQEELAPLSEVNRQEFDELVALRKRLERADSLRQQIAGLRARLATLQGRVGKSKAANVELAPSTAQTHELCEEIESVLKEWGYPNLKRVSFSENHSDLVINGKDRRSHGKGLRALTYAAFTVGLMRHCLSKGLPHPGFVVLDSPLVAYREPDPAESGELPPSVKDLFYRSLASDKTRGQVLVFENEDPPTDMLQAINYIHFTKSTTGRYGFYPV